MVCLEDAHKMSLTAQKWETYRFTSKEFDRETGLYYFGARYYEPKLSRWMSANPAGFELINPFESDGKPKAKYNLIETTNWYSYVGNNPVNRIDPNGELFFLDDFLFSLIGNLFGARNDGVWQGTWDNFKNSWMVLVGTAMSIMDNPWSAVNSMFGFAAYYFGFQYFENEVRFQSSPLPPDSSLFTIEIKIGTDMGAVSLGRIILYGQNMARDLHLYLPHERGHTRQSELLGPLYLLLVGLPSIISASRHGKEGWIHDEYWTERWADRWTVEGEAKGKEKRNKKRSVK